MEKVLLKLTREEADEVYERFQGSNYKELYLIFEWGACGSQEKAKYVLEFGKEKDDNWFGDISFLEASDDGIFVRIKKENYTDKLPNFDDIFKVKRI